MTAEFMSPIILAAMPRAPRGKWLTPEGDTLKEEVEPGRTARRRVLFRHRWNQGRTANESACHASALPTDRALGLNGGATSSRCS